MAKGRGKNKKKQNNNNKYNNNKNGGGQASDQATTATPAAGPNKITNNRPKKNSESRNDDTMTDLFKDDRVMTSHQEKLNDNWAANNSSNSTIICPSNRRPRGLSNLGNTCYFNSVLQVMSKTPLLRSLIDSRSAKDIPWKASVADFSHGQIDDDNALDVLLPSPHEVMISLIVALRNMDIANQKGPFSPGGLLAEISKKNCQFRGRQQQDSHELLRTLLDLIKTEESNRQKQGVLNALQIDDIKNIDDDTKTMIKNCGPFSNFTMIDSLFGGYTLSSIRCSECDSISQILEPFFDLSLPINDTSSNMSYRSWNGSSKKEEAKRKKEGNKTSTSSSVPIALPPPPPPMPKSTPLVTHDVIKNDESVDAEQESRKTKNKELEKNTHVNERKQKRMEKKANKRAVKEAAKSELKKKVVVANDLSAIVPVISNDEDWDAPIDTNSDWCAPTNGWNDIKVTSGDKNEVKNETISPPSANPTIDHTLEDEPNGDAGDQIEKDDRNGKMIVDSDSELSDLDMGIVPLLDEVAPVSKLGVREEPDSKAVVTYQVTEDPKSVEIKVGIETDKAVHLQFDHKSSKGTSCIDYDSNHAIGSNISKIFTDSNKKKDSLDSDMGTTGTPPDDQLSKGQRSLEQSEDEGISEGDGDSSTKAVIDDDERLDQVSVCNLDDFNEQEIEDPDSDENIFGAMAGMFDQEENYDPADYPSYEYYDIPDADIDYQDFGESRFGVPTIDHEGFEPTIRTPELVRKLENLQLFDMKDNETGRPGGVDLDVDDELNNLRLEDLSDPVELSLSTATIDLTSSNTTTDEAISENLESDVKLKADCDAQVVDELASDEAGDMQSPSQSKPPVPILNPVDLIERRKIEWTMTTLKNRKPSGQSEIADPTLESCLSMFTEPEVLTGGNKLFCETCTKRAGGTGPAQVKSSSKGKAQQQTNKVFSDASKSMIIAYPPPILTLHLKRFTAEGFSLRKINRNVKFPFEFDLSPWTSNLYPEMAKSMGIDCNIVNGSLRYKLYGLVEHSGTLKFGHYTATVRVAADRKRQEDGLRKYLRLKPFVSSVDDFLKRIEVPETGFRLPDSDSSDAQKSDANKENVFKYEESEGDKWYYISDSHVSEVKESDVLDTEAYLLFYERIY